MNNGKRSSQLRDTFRISTQEGIFSQIFTSLAGAGSVFITKLAVMLGASPVHFGILSAIGQFAQALQPLGVAITKRKTQRKPIILFLTSVGRAMAPLLGIIPLIFAARTALPLVLSVYLLYSALLAVGANMWMGWIADMVPRKMRGRFFAQRNQILMIAGVLASFVFGTAVDLFSGDRGWLAGQIGHTLGIHHDPSFLPWIFLGIFSTAGVIGLAGMLILRRQPEKPKMIESESYWSILITPFRDKNFRHLAAFGIWWMLAVGIGAPFWQPFMIQRLHMSVIQILLYGTIATAGAQIAIRPWGRFIDRHGNKPAMRLALLLGTLNPLFWIFLSPDSYWFVYIEAFLTGIMWSCVGIVTANMVLAIAPDKYRQMYSGVFNALSCTAMVFTMIASGVFMPDGFTLLGRYMYPEQVLFLVTAITRLSAEIPLSWVNEPDSTSIGMLVRRFNQYTKVNITSAFMIILRRRKPGS
ncbi:MAG: MFS transporter [Candidatus Fermentibacteria bacterium]